jgi:hypothetical protein
LTCVRAKGNAVCDACRLSWEMNVFIEMLSCFAEDVVGVANEHHVFNFFKVSFLDEKVIYFCRDSADDFFGYSCLSVPAQRKISNGRLISFHRHHQAQ